MYFPPVSAFELPNQAVFDADTNTGATFEVFCCEVFASFLLVLVFLTTKFQVNDKNRDFVLVAISVATTSYVVSYLISQVSGTFANPVSSLCQMFQTWAYINKGDPPAYNMWFLYILAQTIGPFVGALLAGLFFHFQKQVLSEIDDIVNDGSTKVDTVKDHKGDPKHEGQPKNLGGAPTGYEFTKIENK